MPGVFFREKCICTKEIIIDEIGRNVKALLSSATPAYLTPAH
jgi:hypothetical protein